MAVDGATPITCNQQWPAAVSLQARARAGARRCQIESVPAGGDAHGGDAPTMVVMRHGRLRAQRRSDLGQQADRQPAAREGHHGERAVPLHPCVKLGDHWPRRREPQSSAASRGSYASRRGAEHGRAAREPGAAQHEGTPTKIVFAVVSHKISTPVVSHKISTPALYQIVMYLTFIVFCARALPCPPLKMRCTHGRLHRRPSPPGQLTATEMTPRPLQNALAQWLPAPAVISARLGAGRLQLVCQD